MAVGDQARSRSQASLGASFAVRAAFIWPALLAILFVSIYPLLVSLYISCRACGWCAAASSSASSGWTTSTSWWPVTSRSVGVMGSLGPVGWMVLAAGVGLLGWGLIRSWRGGASVAGMAFRLLGALAATAAIWVATRTLLAAGGRPGTAVVTLVYVLVGVAVQFLLGLGLATCSSRDCPGSAVPGRLPPADDDHAGRSGLHVPHAHRHRKACSSRCSRRSGSATSLGQRPWGARIAVMVGDIWRDAVHVIILLAALEGQDVQHGRGGMVDGANRWQVFRYISLPAILPVCATVILIRLIEAFKIIDLPNILTNGGPGTATSAQPSCLHPLADPRPRPVGGGRLLAAVHRDRGRAGLRQPDLAADGGGMSR